MTASAPVFTFLQRKVVVEDEGLEYGLIDTAAPQISPRVALNLRAGLAEVLKRYPEQIKELAKWGGMKDGPSLPILRGLQLLVERAEVVIWKPEIWETAVNGASAFAGEVLAKKDCLTPGQFWCWDNGGNVYAPDSSMGQLMDLDCLCGLQNILLLPATLEKEEAKAGRILALGSPDALAAVFVFSPVTKEENPRVLSVLPRLRVAPMFKVGCTIDHTIQQGLIAAKRFMELPFVFVEKAQEPMTRQARRRLERENRPVPEVLVVNLRKLARSSKAGDGDGTGHKLQTRHIVSWPNGQWKRHWWPKEGVHKPTFIQPYVRGPEGAPLAAPRERVLKVAR